MQSVCTDMRKTIPYDRNVFCGKRQRIAAGYFCLLRGKRAVELGKIIGALIRLQSGPAKDIQGDGSADAIEK